MVQLQVNAIIQDRKQSALRFYFVPVFVLLAAFTTGSGTSALSTGKTPNVDRAMKTDYDVIVIGGGSAGLTAAKLSSNTLSKKCLLIEADRLGADCTWTGCIPSKSLLAAAKIMHGAKKMGLVPQSTKADWKMIQKQIQANIQQIYDEDDSPETLETLGVTVVKGRAVLTTADKVTVTMTADATSGGSTDGDAHVKVTAKEGIILCTGAKPRLPSNVDGLSSVDYFTYESIWNQLETIPDRLTIVGGGPIGCELGQAFARLGAKVTLIADQLLPNDDPAVSALLEQVFISEGISVCKGRLVRVQPSSSSSSSRGRGHVCICDSGTTVEGDALLIAVGRAPRCTGMGLEEVGVTLTENQQAIAVNSKLQTSVKGIYAAGDCTGDRQFTHYAGFQGAIAARNILLPLTDPGVLEHVPSTTFTSPEVASIGISEAAALVQYGTDKIVVVQKQLSHVDRAVCESAQEGFIKILYLKKSGQVLGATIVSPSAGEMISEIAVMMKTGMPFEQLATVMHPYPTFAFALQLMAADAYYAKTLKSKWLLDILKRFGL